MKSILVTGSTDGIGLETARQLKALGHRVILHGRNQQRLDSARKALDIEDGLIADFSSLDEVKSMAFKAPALDVLVNNAGVYLKSRSLSKEGIESTLAINHFAPMLLTLSLSKVPSRIVTVASGVHHGGSLDLEDFTMARGFSPYGAYSASKLANVLFAARLARTPGYEKSLSFSLHPGVIDTKLLRLGFGAGGASLASGAKTSVLCSVGEGLEAYNGGYFSDSRPASSQAAQDIKKQEALWEASCSVLKPYLH
jgi:NAD(P)-dependent dehydrogenase (short-subunit alcohol dehydrogenase family)